MKENYKHCIDFPATATISSREAFFFHRRYCWHQLLFSGYAFQFREEHDDCAALRYCVMPKRCASSRIWMTFSVSDFYQGTSTRVARMAGFSSRLACGIRFSSGVEFFKALARKLNCPLPPSTTISCGNSLFSQ